MKKFEGILFCTDLDGTLYSDDKTVSKENLDAIERFIDGAPWEKLPENKLAGAKYDMLT